jgi:hypothetical protein
VSAAFDVDLEGGDYIKGSFELTQFGGGTITVDASWQGATLSQWTSSVGWWNSGIHQEEQDDVIHYFDEDLFLRFHLGAPQGLGTFSVPNQRSLFIQWLPDDGVEIEEEPLSGWLTIEEYEANVRVKGNFSAQYLSGGLSGSFEVPLTNDAFE